MWYLESSDTNTTIKVFETFDKDKIRQTIVEHLSKFPNDYIEYSKDYKQPTKFAGTEHLGLYTSNPITNEPCRVIIKCEREYYKPINIK